MSKLLVDMEDHESIDCATVILSSFVLFVWKEGLTNQPGRDNGLRISRCFVILKEISPYISFKSYGLLMEER